MKSLFPSRIPRHLLYYLFGVCIVFFVDQQTGCKPKDNPVESTDTQPVVTTDVNKIKEGATAVETAFKSGAPQKVIDLLTDDAKSAYSTRLQQAKSDQLIEVGKAFESKQLDVYSDLYAEYKYSKDGKTFSLGLSRQEDGSWKLMRF